MLVADQYGNPVSGAAVSFSGAGGTFSNPVPENTNSADTAAQFYTLPAASGAITITATVGGVTNGATFGETAQ